MTIFVVVKEKLSPLIIVSFALFVLIVTVIAIIPLIQRGLHDPLPITFILLILSSATLGILYTFRKYSRLSRLMDRLRTTLTITDTVIKLPYSMEVEGGEAEVIGYWIRRGRSSSYYSKCVFKPLSTSQYIDSIHIDNVSPNFTVLVLPDNSGIIKAPAYRILDPQFKDSILLILNPRNLKLSMENTTISVISTNDVAEASIEVQDNVMKGTVRRLFIGKAREARLELHGKIKVDKRTLYGRKVIAKAKNRSTSFREVLVPQEPIVILLHKDATSPMKITKHLGWKAPVLLGFNDGEYKLRLILDIPLRRDIYEEIAFKPTRASSLNIFNKLDSNDPGNHYQ